MHKGSQAAGERRILDRAYVWANSGSHRKGPQKNAQVRKRTVSPRARPAARSYHAHGIATIFLPRRSEVTVRPVTAASRGGPFTPRVNGEHA